MFPLSTPLPLKNYLYYPKKEILQGSDFRTFAEIRKNSYNEAAKEVCDMKKARIIAVIAALIVSLSGCANTDHPQTIQNSSGIETVTSETYERTEPEDSSSASVSESKESAADNTAAVKAETESAQTENLQSAAEQSPEPGTQPPQTAVPNNTPKPETPKAVESTPEPKPAPTQQPTPPPAEETPKVEQPQETTPAPEEPAPKSIYDYEFDVAAIRSELIAVGEAMGLTHSGNLTPDSASWSTPVTASSDFQGANLERRLKDYVQSMPGLITAFGGNQIEYFTIYAEPLGGGSYRFYFLY